MERDGLRHRVRIPALSLLFTYLFVVCSLALCCNIFIVACFLQPQQVGVHRR